MDMDTTIFWSFCLISLFIGKAVSDYIFPNPRMFLEEYGGCDCGRDGCEKIDMIDYRGKIYRRINIQESNMTYKYCKIYNVSKGEWARDVSGGDDAHIVWNTNEWDENDALVGFYSDDVGDFHNVIFCRPGYAVYVQTEDDKDKDVYTIDGTEYRIPPAMLVNLNDAYDTEFVHAKNYPEETDSDDSDSESDYSDSDEDEPLKKLRTHIPENQRVINFLYTCRAATDNEFKKDAYDAAIKEFHSYWSTIYPPTWKPCTIGPSIERKIREFLDGFPEDDIINS